MPKQTEPSCWRTAAITFLALAGVLLVIVLTGGGDATAVALQ